MCPFFNLPNWYLLLCAQCVVCISSIFATSCKVCCFFSSMLAKDFIITCHFPSNSLWKATLKRMMLGNQLAYFACMRNVLKAKVKLCQIFLFKTSIHHYFIKSKIALWNPRVQLDNLKTVFFLLLAILDYWQKNFCYSRGKP